MRNAIQQGDSGPEILPPPPPVFSIELVNGSTGYGSGSVFDPNVMCLVGVYLYFSNPVVPGVYVLDTTNPASLVEITSLDPALPAVDLTVMSSGVAYMIYDQARSKVYMIGNDSCIGVLDVTTPTAPVFETVVASPNGSTGIFFNPLVIDGSYMYVTFYIGGFASQNGCYVYDVSSGVPSLVNTILNSVNAGGGGNTVIGQTLYFCDYFSKLVGGTPLFHASDITDPTIAIIDSSIDASDGLDPTFETWGMLTYGGILYIVDDAFCQVWDVTAPLAPVYVTTVDIGADTEGSVISNGYLFTSVNGSSKITALDLTNPLAPVAAGELATSSGASRLNTVDDARQLLFCCVGGVLTIFHYTT